VYDLTSNRLRPIVASGQGTGLPIFPGLLRAEELEAGAIHHALRFSAPRLRRGFEWPARGSAADADEPDLPPVGARLRLRRDFDLSRYSQRVAVVLVALKRYGMLLAEAGEPWSLSAGSGFSLTAQERVELAGVHGSDFEAVDTSAMVTSEDSGRAAVPFDRPPVSTGVGSPFECVVSDRLTCIDGLRFAVRVEWIDRHGGERVATAATAGSRDTSLFWFFDPLNWELMVKVIDGCAVNRHHWVFFAGTTDLGFTVTVADSLTGETRRYRNPSGEAAVAVTDNQAFSHCLP
jgi:hypothetical protein